jgi:malate dehydrogenase (oxaloacetate-decarboxylating)(NADP+)
LGLEGRLAMESTVKDARNGPSGWVVDNKSTVGGGVQDIYGEDCATEDQIITPWSISVARSV